ncbi:MAG: hypothetical protein HY608_06360 [Planctomycetes bacterium]|nr:hypothetical protein [Planctomycetota bacterium]
MNLSGLGARLAGLLRGGGRRALAAMPWRAAAFALLLLGLYLGMDRTVRARDGARIGAHGVRLAALAPELREEGIRSDLESALRPFRGRSIHERGILGEIAERAAGLPWIHEVRRVSYRFEGEGVAIAFDLQARLPAARVVQGGRERLVDRVGVVLPPAIYAEGLDLPSIHGVRGGAPAPGVAWGDERLRVALRVLEAYRARGFASRRTGLGVAVVRVGSLSPETAGPQIVVVTREGKELRFSHGEGPGRLPLDEQLDRLEEALADPRVWVRVQQYVDLRFADHIPAR